MLSAIWEKMFDSAAEILKPLQLGVYFSLLPHQGFLLYLTLIEYSFKMKHCNFDIVDLFLWRNKCLIYEGKPHNLKYKQIFRTFHICFLNNPNETPETKNREHKSILNRQLLHPWKYFFFLVTWFDFTLTKHCSSFCSDLWHI